MGKIDTSCQGDASRILDLVRASLVCNSIKEAVLALEYVMENSRVLTINNRFDLDCDASDTGGYRDVNVKLTFDIMEGTDFEGFIFECRIALASFLSIQSAEGHARSIRCRNLLG